MTLLGVIGTMCLVTAVSMVVITAWLLMIGRLPGEDIAAFTEMGTVVAAAGLAGIWLLGTATVCSKGRGWWTAGMFVLFCLAIWEASALGLLRD